MPKYTITLAGNMRAYYDVEIEAEDADAALARAQHLAENQEEWGEPAAPEMSEAYFRPESDTLDDIEALEDSMTVEEDDEEDE
jgi:hypothetical protein